MKNISLITNGVLLIAVGVLYYLHFSASGNGVSMPTGKAATSNMVYVNIDSLLDNYHVYNKMKSDFEQKQASFEQEVMEKKSLLEKEYMDAQKRAKEGQMTETQMGQMEESLSKKQQELMELKQTREEMLMEENQKMTKDVFSKIQAHLRELNKETNYQFVFGYTRDGGILFANDSLDITSTVLQGLNKAE